jgi:type IV pilus assembly protein PilB
MPIDYQKLTSALVEAGLLTNDQVAAAQQKASSEQRSLEEVLVDDEYISAEHLGQIVADFFDVPYINLQKKSIDESVLRIIPELVARRQRLIAFARDGAGIKLAMADPADDEIQQFIAKKSGEAVTPYYATPGDIIDTLSHYRKGLTEEFDSIIKENIAASQTRSEQEREVPITRIVDTILEYAYQNKVSDIHIEPHEKKVVVRFRIDGILHDVVFLPKEIIELVVMRIKIMSQLRTDEHRAAQDGRLDFVSEGAKVDVRVSILPVTDGEKVVMRILSEKSRQFKLADLGLGPDDLQEVENNFKKPYGMILATGPTGSGKTTTLYAILKILNTREVNISTIEDPVEYDIEGINQIQVNPKTNLTFAKGLRSILRQDPDIIMVGEIRDEETAGIAINSAMTGHLVLSTLHTNDAPTTLPRLLDMHIEPFLIASTVNVAIGQRLVRKIHQNCLESYLPDTKQTKAIEDTIGKERAEKMGLHKKGLRLYRGKGCKLCNGTGYEGRIGIFEVMDMTEEIRRLIMTRANSDEIRAAAIHGGMTTMLDDGLKKVLGGVTTIEEVMRATTE